MTDRELMQQALDAWDDPAGMKDLCVAMDAIRTALEQQAEPVHGDIRALKYRIHELEGEVIGYKRMLDVAEAASQPQQQAEPSQWRDMVVVSLVREGVNKHKARELADHFAAPPQQQAEALQAMNDQLTTGISIMLDGKRVDPASVYKQAEPVSHAVIAGALFDFMGWLTTRKERLVLSSTDNASPAADAIKDFAEMRGLLLDDAKVQDWQDYTTPPQRQWVGLTNEEIGQIILQQEITLKNYVCVDKQTEFARAIEAKLKERNHD